MTGINLQDDDTKPNLVPEAAASGTFFSNVESRVHKVHILLIQLLPQQLHSLAKALEVDYLPFPKEFDHVVHIRVVGKTQNVVIGDPGLLLWERIP